MFLLGLRLVFRFRAQCVVRVLGLVLLAVVRVCDQLFHCLFAGIWVCELSLSPCVIYHMVCTYRIIQSEVIRS